ncbi:MAG: hypothetical protein AB1Z65_11505 [Candidatus Sulfomarinibacteraceae bacterium]
MRTSKLVAGAIATTVMWTMTVATWAGGDGPASMTLVGWNDLGMHCMDADYSVMAILPPYNTIHAQLVDSQGNLVTVPGGITVTYEAVADPTGSVNTTSIGKTNFWDYVLGLFGAGPAPDEGLAGFDMPGAGNPPLSMVWEPGHNWFTAEGVPITPYDDSAAKNYYPLMRLVARDGGGNVLASTDIVLPVSDEMDCSACHASGSPAAGQPPSGWVWDPDPERDYRLNILALHDDLHSGQANFQNALAAVGYNPAGLRATATVDGRSVLCATCHLSNALPGTGVAGVPPLTRAIHDLHASVQDPLTGLILDDSDNRSACYRCHPGSDTRCLRGAMGNAVSSAGDLAMQCQNCHGSMSVVGSAGRDGWLDEPTCQNCHTGTAVHNNGQIRYTDAFDPPGQLRQAVDQTFATNDDVPVAGSSLYRFSEGHGGLQCSVCHGSTHAIYPSSHANDNLQNIGIQGHEGTLVECASCHGAQPQTFTGGPHGMHPVGDDWVDAHTNAPNTNGCRDCHGADDRGTVLSRAHADRTLQTGDFGTKNLWRGYQIGCYLCHNGPDSENPTPNTPAVVNDATAQVDTSTVTAIPLTATDVNGDTLELRVVSQPINGLAWIDGATAYFRPLPGLAGGDQFTFAAWDGMADSNLGTVTVTVTDGVLFGDGFETGDTSGWSSTAP